MSKDVHEATEMDQASEESESPQVKVSREGVEVLAIYPYNPSRTKWLVQGNVEIKIHSAGLQVRNVPYSIDKKNKVKVQAPFRYHRFPSGGRA